MWAVIGWIFFGLIVGIIAKVFVRGGHGFQGCLPTIVLGVLGSVVGGYLGKWIGIYKEIDFHPGGIFMSILGAVLILTVYGAFMSRRGPN